MSLESALFFFFFKDTATTEIYTLSLHDALPIFDDDAYLQLDDVVVTVRSVPGREPVATAGVVTEVRARHEGATYGDRKSTRLNSSHANISYAVFCLKKKKLNSHPPSRLLPVYVF